MLLTTVLSVFSTTTIAQAASVMIPLYIYPTENAWDPLTDALTKYPNLEFTIIINPNSGPSYFDDTYKTAVTDLKTYKNARVIGYVRTNYGDLSVSDIEADIQTYQSWDAAYAMQGIFFDEVADDKLSFYTPLYSLVHSLKLGSGDTPTVVLNPGAAVSADYFSIAEQIVTFEQSYSHFQEISPTIDNAKASVIIHSLADTSVLSKLVASLEDAASLYITDVDIANADVYASFGSTFSQFVADVAGRPPVSGNSSSSSSAQSSSASARSHSASPTSSPRSSEFNSESAEPYSEPEESTTNDHNHRPTSQTQANLPKSTADGSALPLILSSGANSTKYRWFNRVSNERWIAKRRVSKSAFKPPCL